MDIRIPKRAIIGGSFDPVHLGHLHLIHSIYESTGISRITLIPAFINNFKQDAKPAAPAHRRCEMLHLALTAYPALYPDDCALRLDVDEREIRRGGVSYTVDTVEALRKEDKMEDGERLGLVIGDDLIAGLDRWHRFSELATQVVFLICRRLPKKPALPLPRQACAIYIDNPVHEDSSSMVRRKAASGADVSGLSAYLPGEVARYVLEHRLYGA
ncbi:nicotinate (nicotinamide) nucleotide adenylyltransferase [Parasphaerochaeta coccoides]|uniref:Probable nicotinate-nucleotide adenylyltransferase n=1 Tax=Parasphaerochaeta coccoides (strain ATCC BAA-1237 / DSM 17374 / SPN1) TaxID=760011 RepID=F4GJF8_PARC1|nr:nicotinate (nicotinamide) nucleotide adenylyltransferase [Parasphaerochaeta coccoides]AEC02223.1 nicotinate-nucleotide adenylyltransferase [Parasphaerochaeta coccoides DSM 17374]